MPQPVPVAPPPRAFSQKDLPPSVEIAYYRKCVELRRRIHDIEENNDGTRLRIKRLHRAITKMRLERAFLLEQLHKHMEYNIDDSDRSSSLPPTPTDKPLRSKRSHRQKTPPQGGSQLGLPGGGQHASPSSSAHQHVLAPSMNPMSSAQSTPDPSSRTSNPFFTNGTSQTGPTSLLPRAQESSTRGAYFDPAYDEQRPADNDDAPTGRRRARSSAHAPAGEDGEPNGDVDTEMGNTSGAGFTAVNN